MDNKIGFPEDIISTIAQSKKSQNLKKETIDLDLDRDSMRLRERHRFGRVSDGVLPNSHGVDLDLFRDAFDLSRLEIEPETSNWRGQEA